MQSRWRFIIIRATGLNSTMPFNDTRYTSFKSLLRYASLGMLVLACIYFYFHLYDYLTLNTLKYYQSTAQAWTAMHYQLAVSIYIISLPS